MTKNLWDRPAGSAMPNRFGDLTKDEIFLALGKAVSAWEGVQVALNELFLALSHDRDAAIAALIKFSECKTPERAKQIRGMAKNFYLQRQGDLHLTALRGRIEHALNAYIGWAQRRNDLAHGYLTEAFSPNYQLEEAPIVQNFALCPSHARQSKWTYAEPEFNYLSQDILHFEQEFKKLDVELMNCAEQLRTTR